jgi:hypothetical protein
MADPDASTGWSNRWSDLPKPLRRGLALAVVTVFIAGGVLYQTNVRAKRPPEFSRGGTFAQGDRNAPILGEDLSIETPTPSVPPSRLRSSAVLTAPDQPGALPPGGAGAPDLPTIGRYIYSVEGYESVTAFGRRDYPAEMTMTVHRAQDANQPLKADELVFDLKFSEEHEEREIVSFRRGGIFFTYESGSITFGPGQTRSSEADYKPPMLQIPFPLEVGEQQTGTTVATNPDTAAELRTEDWTVEVLRRESITVLNETVDAWVVQIDRQSRPGSSESVTRSRTYWFDPTRSIWVKWHETLNGSQDFGPGTFTYSTDFTATLARVQAR